MCGGYVGRAARIIEREGHRAAESARRRCRQGYDIVRHVLLTQQRAGCACASAANTVRVGRRHEKEWQFSISHTPYSILQTTRLRPPLHGVCVSYKKYMELEQPGHSSCRASLRRDLEAPAPCHEQLLPEVVAGAGAIAVTGHCKERPVDLFRRTGLLNEVLGIEVRRRAGRTSGCVRCRHVFLVRLVEQWTPLRRAGEIVDRGSPVRFG